MNVTITLSGAELDALRAIAGHSGLSLERAVVACTLYTANMKFENPAELRAELRDARSAHLDPAGRLPCGLAVRRPSPI